MKISVRLLVERRFDDLTDAIRQRRQTLTRQQARAESLKCAEAKQLYKILADPNVNNTPKQFNARMRRSGSATDIEKATLVEQLVDQPTKRRTKQ